MDEGAVGSCHGQEAVDVQLAHYEDFRGAPAEFIGIVEAPDEDSAIKAAIEEYQITDPEQQKRLAARRRD